MPKIKLDSITAARVQCEPGKKKTDWYDEAVTGFVLECRSTGGKTYYLRYDRDGRQCQHKIGRYGDITFAVARKAAERLRSQVVTGTDPAAVKAVAKSVPTYAELAAKHLAHVQGYQRSLNTTEMYIRRHILPRWGKLRVNAINKHDVAQWLAAKTAEGLALATVEKIRVIFGRSFSLALEWGTPGVTTNPTQGIKRPPINNKRERFLSPAEAQRLQQAVAASRNPMLKYIVGLLLLTGARKSELLNAEWRHIDVERQSWLIPTSKTGKPRHVPLSQAAIDIIGQLPRFEGCTYLLPNPETKKPYTDIKHSWMTAVKKANLSGTRLHDCRHTFASSCMASNVSLFTVGRVLGHADHKSTMRYSHLANDTLLAAVEAGAAKQNVAWITPNEA